jgi:hypothetical protein
MADIEPRIRSVLAGTPYAVQKIGPLWQIRVGNHAGARENGSSLAHDLLAKWRIDPTPATPVATPAPATEPQPVQAKAVTITPLANMTVAPEWMAEAEMTKARLDQRPRPVPAPPAEIADLLRVHETYEQTNERLLPLYREAKNMIEMAIGDEVAGIEGSRARRMKWEAKAERIETAIHWNRGRKIETL